MWADFFPLFLLGELGKAEVLKVLELVAGEPAVVELAVVVDREVLYEKQDQHLGHVGVPGVEGEAVDD